MWPNIYVYLDTHFMHTTYQPFSVLELRSRGLRIDVYPWQTVRGGTAASSWSFAFYWYFLYILYVVAQMHFLGSWGLMQQHLCSRSPLLCAESVSNCSCDRQVRSPDRRASTVVYINPEKRFSFAGGLTERFALRAGRTTSKQTCFGDSHDNRFFPSYPKHFFLCQLNVFVLIPVLNLNHSESCLRPSPLASSTACSWSKLISPLPLWSQTFFRLQVTR